MIKDEKKKFNYIFKEHNREILTGKGNQLFIDLYDYYARYLGWCPTSLDWYSSSYSGDLEGMTDKDITIDAGIKDSFETYTQLIKDITLYLSTMDKGSLSEYLDRLVSYFDEPYTYNMFEPFDAVIYAVNPEESLKGYKNNFLDGCLLRHFRLRRSFSGNRDSDWKDSDTGRNFSIAEMRDTESGGVEVIDLWEKPYITKDEYRNYYIKIGCFSLHQDDYPNEIKISKRFINRIADYAFNDKCGIASPKFETLAMKISDKIDALRRKFPEVEPFSRYTEIKNTGEKMETIYDYPMTEKQEKDILSVRTKEQYLKGIKDGIISASDGISLLFRLRFNPVKAAKCITCPDFSNDEIYEDKHDNEIKDLSLSRCEIYADRHGNEVKNAYGEANYSFDRYNAYIDRLNNPTEYESVFRPKSDIKNIKKVPSVLLNSLVRLNNKTPYKLKLINTNKIDFDVEIWGLYLMEIYEKHRCL